MFAQSQSANISKSKPTVGNMTQNLRSSAVQSTGGNDTVNTALSTDEGFMRGARIAEKIQEYYH